MFNRRFVMLFAVVSVMILGTGFFTARYLARDLQAHLQTETNRLAYSRVLLSTRLLDDAVLNNNYTEIKKVIEGLVDDAEIACVQYRDGDTLLSTHGLNEPCVPLTDEGLFAITLSEEHDHSHNPNPETVAPEKKIQKKILEVAVKGDYTRKMTEKVRYPFFILGIEFIVSLLLLGLYFSLSSRALSKFLVGSFRKIALGEKAEAPRSILLSAAPITQSLAEIEKNLLEYQRLVTDRVESEVLVKVASQVSHDVRAPLGAMELIVGNLTSIDSEQKEILRTAMKRIRDISDSLLSKQKQVQSFVQTSVAMAKSAEPFVEVVLGDAIGEIVREKRVGLPPAIQIQWAPSLRVQAKVQPAEFKRLLSNLLNNAIESMNSGVITLNESAIGAQYELSIQDQGKGIAPADLVRLGEYGVTIGKEEGKGIGLHHAIQTLRSWGGDLKIESVVGEGTKVRLLIPMSSNGRAAANWKNKKTIALGLNESELKEVHANSSLVMEFHSASEFKKYYGAHFADLDEVIFVLSSTSDSSEWMALIDQFALNSQVSWCS